MLINHYEEAGFAASYQSAVVGSGAITSQSDLPHWLPAVPLNRSWPPVMHHRSFFFFSLHFPSLLHPPAAGLGPGFIFSCFIDTIYHISLWHVASCPCSRSWKTGNEKEGKVETNTGGKKETREEGKLGRQKGRKICFDWLYFILSLWIGWSQVPISLTENSGQNYRLSFSVRFTARLRVPAAELWPRPAWSGRTFKVLPVTLHLPSGINSWGGGAADAENIRRYSQKQRALEAGGWVQSVEAGSRFRLRALVWILQLLR